MMAGLRKYMLNICCQLLLREGRKVSETRKADEMAHQSVGSGTVVWASP